MLLAGNIETVHVYIDYKKECRNACPLMLQKHKLSIVYLDSGEFLLSMSQINAVAPLPDKNSVSDFCTEVVLLSQTASQKVSAIFAEIRHVQD